MSTKAQDFRAEQQRQARPAKPKKTAKRKRPASSAAAAADETMRTGAVSRGTATRNQSLRAGRKGGAKLEDSLSGKPSRKSTRKSEGHVKPSNQARQAIRKARSPQRRAQQGKVGRG